MSTRLQPWNNQHDSSWKKKWPFKWWLPLRSCHHISLSHHRVCHWFFLIRCDLCGVPPEVQVLNLFIDYACSQSLHIRGSLYYQPKQCTFGMEMLENHYRFELFEYPQMANLMTVAGCCAPSVATPHHFGWPESWFPNRPTPKCCSQRLAETLLPVDGPFLLKQHRRWRRRLGHFKSKSLHHEFPLFQKKVEGFPMYTANMIIMNL